MKRTNTTSILGELANAPRKGPGRAGAARVQSTTMKVTAFFRPFNRVAERMRVYTIDFVAPRDTSVEDLIEMAHAAGASRGARSPAGVFELQTDDGIWSTPDSTKLLTTSNSGLSERAQFSSWEQMDAAEQLPATAPSRKGTRK